MKFGTIVYDNEIYNLDYMTADEVKKVFDTVENSKLKDIAEGKNLEQKSL